MEPRLLKIAAIEHDPGDQLILRRLLAAVPEWLLRYTGYEDADDALLRLPEDPPDLVFLDYLLGARNGLQVLRELRQAGIEAPVILLTGNGDENVAVQAMQAGAADYIVKTALSVNCLRRAANTALNQSDLQRKLYQQREHLERSNEELLRRNEAIRGFHHLLSHELRGPTAAAMNSAELLLDGSFGELNEQQREFVTIIENSCQQILVQIQDLLDVSRMETGKLSLRRQPTDLASFVERTVKAVTPAAQSQAIQLECETAADLPELEVDRERIGQVLHNLLNNALKFTPPEGTIRVSLARDAAEPDFVRISVEDTGCGIPQEHLPRLFERLYQVAESDARDKGGLGLGLSLCRDLIGLHGGRIGVDSAPNQGSTFWFLLPLATQSSELQHHGPTAGSHD
ncbi:MAG TPA: hybrid sensor histidine kinase/response regulator [Planctomycetota bacterium]|nr:hybrid sensor histidine kinase/response regulator [Planctomycetota bacterium]